MNARKLAIIIGVPVVAIGWFLFRPELLFINKSVSESFPTTAVAASSTSMKIADVPLAAGRFHSVAHETKGTATVHQLPGGRRVLRLTNFETSNGPDVRVLLVAAADASDNDTVKNNQPVELGKLKGNIGDQNYDVPDTVDLARYRAVSVWCNRFGVNFGTAPLSMPDANMGAMESMLLRTGRFHSVAHETKGKATVHQLADGRQVLRLTGFETSNGPDVRVLLVAATDALDNDSVKNGSPIELGRLKGNIGDQNYEVPAGTDLNVYRAVTIWCNRFGVNFGTAPLTKAAQSS